jgi:hypothetical protein
VFGVWCWVLGDGKDGARRRARGKKNKPSRREPWAVGHEPHFLKHILFSVSHKYFFLAAPGKKKTVRKKLNP